MGRPRHPDKDIEKAVQYAENLGWRVVISGGHAWGRLFCPASERGGCIISVWSTPKDPHSHARHIRRQVDICDHGMGDNNDIDEDSAHQEGSGNNSGKGDET